MLITINLVKMIYLILLQILNDFCDPNGQNKEFILKAQSPWNNSKFVEMIFSSIQKIIFKKTTLKIFYFLFTSTKDKQDMINFSLQIVKIFFNSYFYLRTEY